MPILVSEFVPGDTSSITNRVFTMNLVTLGAMAKTERVPTWVWWSDKYRELYSGWSHTIYTRASVHTEEEFVDQWRRLNQDAMVICDEADMTLNRSVTATTIALLGFEMMNEDSGGQLTKFYPAFCDALSTCLREMSRLVTDVGPMTRFITSIRSGWSAIEGRYSAMVSDRVITCTDKYGLIVDHHTLHGILIDTRRIDPSRLGNAATVGMILQGEGFTIIENDKIFKGRYHISLAKFVNKEWAHDLTRLTKLMGCSCANLLTNTLELE
jgi:hypothetical protein